MLVLMLMLMLMLMPMLMLVIVIEFAFPVRAFFRAMFNSQLSTPNAQRSTLN
jgi:hypothetical protein